MFEIKSILTCFTLYNIHLTYYLQLCCSLVRLAGTTWRPMGRELFYVILKRKRQEYFPIILVNYIQQLLENVPLIDWFHSKCPQIWRFGCYLSITFDRIIAFKYEFDYSDYIPDGYLFKTIEVAQRGVIFSELI